MPVSPYHRNTDPHKRMASAQAGMLYANKRAADYTAARILLLLVFV